MTFCKEMPSRVEEPFCKNICFLGIDTKYGTVQVLGQPWQQF